ncbi:sensor of blue-light using FAD [Marichromatium purpuratum 984]|uniref:Sensor of blue-light using FAD n=1 Tax=Marichromatium purpuratum 984 TaxID=765910 RepID=W0E014_MARPU|nr:BLUF domain-containing protein [Marichromatium purpuratum]AHF02579.1 sensor of blue-light using FAD [Marichromatium purpuratum 984]
MEHLSRILYVSRTSQGVGEAELKQILEQSNRHNKEQRISGILCAGGGHFIQVLEGPQEAVFRLYGRILDDRRHYDSLLIGVAPIKQRMFQGWSMGYLSNPPEVMEARRKQLLAMWERRAEADELVVLMRKFLEQLRG